jgi:hypothetical protein
MPMRADPARPSHPEQMTLPLVDLGRRQMGFLRRGPQRIGPGHLNRVALADHVAILDRFAAAAP